MMFGRHALLFAVIAIAGCPRDQDTPPENDTSTSDASATMGTTGPSTISASSTNPSTDDTGPVDTSGSESSTGEDCLGPMDCWNCDPVEPEQFLNHCTDADCEPFDNSPTRLPLLEADGTLPPIP